MAGDSLTIDCVLGNAGLEPANDNPPIDHEWRRELRERAPGIVAQYKHHPSSAKRWAAEWWRKKFVAEFGREPVWFS